MESATWGSRAWQEDHFPADELDGKGDTWGIRWRGVEKMRHSSYLDVAGDTLRSERPLRILDLGCALCDFTVRAWDVNRRNVFWCVDISANAIAWDEERFPQFTFARAALPAIPFEGPFDLVFCLEVLCYLDAADRRRAIDEIHARLAPGGRLLFSGVLDDGARYHTRDEVDSLLKGAFEVERLHFNYWSLHRRFVENPARRFADRARRLSDRLAAGSNPGTARDSKNTVVRGLQLLGPVSRRASSGLARAAEGWIARKTPAVALHRLQRRLDGPHRADEIVVLAVRRGAEEASLLR